MVKRLCILVGALLGVALAGCDLTRMVGNPKTGFTLTFPEKWAPSGSIKEVPEFVQQAVRFACPFDKCGRHALGTGLYGRLPEHMRVAEGTLPHADDVVALVDLTLFMRGQFKDRHLRRAPVGRGDGYRIDFKIRNAQGMAVVVHAAMVFNGDRFLFTSVSMPTADDALAEKLLDEIADRISLPAPAAS